MIAANLTMENVLKEKNLLLASMALQAVSKRAMHAAGVLAHQQSIQELQARTESANALQQEIPVLHPDYKDAVPPAQAEIIHIMRSGLERYRQGLSLDAVQVERRAVFSAAAKHPLHSMFFSFTGDNGRTLTVELPLMVVLNRNIGVLQIDSARPAEITIAGTKLDTTHAIYAPLVALFVPATLHHTENRWMFISMPSAEDIQHAQKTLEECLPVLNATLQLPDNYWPPVRAGQ